MLTSIKVYEISWLTKLLVLKPHKIRRGKSHRERMIKRMKDNQRHEGFHNGCRMPSITHLGQSTLSQAKQE